MGPRPSYATPWLLPGTTRAPRPRQLPTSHGHQLEKNLAREKLQHQAIHLGRVLVRGPVAGLGNPVHVEHADGAANLADQELGGAECGIVALAPEQADATAESREVAEERPAGADLAAVEAGATHTAGLDVHGLLGDARGGAQHVDEQVVAPVLPRAHAAVEKDEVRPAAAAVAGHPGRAVAQEARDTRVSSSRSRAATIASSPGWRLIGSTAISST